MDREKLAGDLKALDSSEKIARDIARDNGNEGWWHFYHPIVKATVRWLDEQGYLLIVERTESE